MRLSTLRAPSAWLPIAMSAIALAVIAAHVIAAGTAREPDEGAAAHLWQLLMAGQIPIIIWFLIRWLPQGPRPAIAVLAAQIAAIMAAVAPVVLLGL